MIQNTNVGHYNIVVGDLKRKADELIKKSVTAGSRKVYDAALHKLTVFCQERRIHKKDKFDPTTIECFVVDLHEKKLGCSTIQTILSGLRHHCKANSIAIRFDTDSLKLVLQGIRKSDTNSKRSRSTNHVTKAHLTKLCHAADLLYCSNIAIMCKAIFCVAFFGLLRPCEMSRSKGAPQHQLRRKNIKFTTNFLVFTFESFKHSVSGNVSVKVKKLPEADAFLCPWRNLYSYLSKNGSSDQQPLFNISNSDLADMLQECCSAASIKSKLSLHSFRRGGATWYSFNGMPDASLRALGRWSSNAYQVYVKAS